VTYQKREDLLSKEEHVKNFIKSFAAVEEAIEPFKDQKRDLRSSYDENKWLSKEEMRMAVKAYRLMKSDTDFEQLADYFKKLKRHFPGISNV
jgi:hypothetical protein